MLKFNSSALQADQQTELKTKWIHFLPIIADQKESIFVQDYLCELMMSGDACVSKENMKLKKIVHIVADIVFANATVSKNLLQIIHELHENQRELFQFMANDLPKDQKEALELAYSRFIFSLGN